MICKWEDIVGRCVWVQELENKVIIHINIKIKSKHAKNDLVIALQALSECQTDTRLTICFHLFFFLSQKLFT